ncbi:hypothetical protein NGM10_05995 [Halorussus salilacus]|uniref:hypothetical protein n=1 Tax=Halorussus salilacus TaxID=2953750 RepID=UPI00209EA791|nr:hypothetical protein [Halorussus salilacus]USZ69286.1 hypothetical protein NGM10_05995 [Halorussus salilacus]
MSRRHSPTGLTLDSPRLLASATAVALAEATLRLLLGWAVHPLLALVVPPVVAVVGLGALAPGVRRALAEGPPVEWNLANARDRAAALAAAATLGHAVAVLAGTAAFLLLDTPVRAALYWLGHGDALALPVLVATPPWGVAVGTLLAWAVVAPAVVRVAEGDSVGGGFLAALAVVVERPREAAVGVGWHLGYAGLVSLAVLTGLEYGAGSGSVVALVGVAGTLTLLVSPFALAVLAAFHVGRVADAGPAGAPRAGERPRRSVPVARVTLAVLLLTGLVGVAGAVRVAEFRPTDASPDPLPEDPDAMYATAFENAERADHRYRVAVAREEGEPFVVEHRIDRDARRYRQIPSGVASGPSVYAGSGTGSPPLRSGTLDLALGEREVGDRTVRAAPDYLRWADRYSWDDPSGLTPPAPGVEGWEVVDRDGDRIVLELADPAAVVVALQGREADAVTKVDASRIRATVDADRGTLSAVETRLNATVETGGEQRRYDGRTTHEFEVGVNVERPGELGSPGLGEWLWRLFVY